MKLLPTCLVILSICGGCKARNASTESTEKGDSVVRGTACTKIINDNQKPIKSIRNKICIIASVDGFNSVPGYCAIVVGNAIEEPKDILPAGGNTYNLPPVTFYLVTPNTPNNTDIDRLEKFKLEYDSYWSPKTLPGSYGAWRFYSEKADQRGADKTKPAALFDIVMHEANGSRPVGGNYLIPYKTNVAFQGNCEF